MKNITPFELKAIKFESGLEHQKITASLYLNGKKIGEILDDGWCDELYIEFKGMKEQEHFNDEFQKCCRKKGFSFKEPESFLNSLIEINKMSQDNSKKRLTKKSPVKNKK